jgi:hypothetical protein
MSEPTPKLSDERLAYIRAEWGKWREHKVANKPKAAQEFIDFVPELLGHIDALEAERKDLRDQLITIEHLAYDALKGRGASAESLLTDIVWQAHNAIKRTTP